MSWKEKKCHNTKELKEKTGLSVNDFARLFGRSVVEVLCDDKGESLKKVIEAGESCNYDVDHMIAQIESALAVLKLEELVNAINKENGDG